MKLHRARQVSVGSGSASPGTARFGQAGRWSGRVGLGGARQVVVGSGFSL